MLVQSLLFYPVDVIPPMNEFLFIFYMLLLAVRKRKRKNIGKLELGYLKTTQLFDAFLLAGWVSIGFLVRIFGFGLDFKGLYFLLGKVSVIGP